MSPSKKSDETSVATQALALLAPPNEAMLLEADTAKAVEKLDRIVKRGRADEQKTQAVLDALNAGPPVMYTRGGGLGVGTVVGAGTSSFLDSFLGLYVPVDASPSWLPASQRYMHEQTWMQPTGAAVAHKSNGKLTSIQGPNTTVSSESSWSGVYASFQPEQARFGTLSRVTIDPEISWTGRDTLDVDYVWSAHIGGQIWFDYRIWTVVYQLNVANGQWEQLLSNRSAVATSVARSSWYIGGGGAIGHSGVLRNGGAALAFVVEPNRTYLFGVVAQMQVSHSLRRTDGQPIPQPSAKELASWGMLKADVPAIYMSHEVLAK